LTQEGLLWGARFWEEGAPEEANPVDWLLLSPLPLSSVEDALNLLQAQPDLVTSFGFHL